MHVDEVIKKIGEHMEKVLEEDADAFNWDVKNTVVKDVVKFEKLGKIFLLIFFFNSIFSPILRIFI